MDLNNKQQNDSSEETKSPQSSQDTPINIEELLLVLSAKLANLEQRVSQLENPQLMYKRPTATERETLAQTLDYLHNNVEGIKKDLLRVAKAV
jgi:small-conductance mechanosensitive channel|tara:strand:- start:1863 stop:2141 length:279 start_codon:yes stop_codon:yes gene_type:complete